MDFLGFPVKLDDTMPRDALLIVNYVQSDDEFMKGVLRAMAEIERGERGKPSSALKRKPSS